MSRPPGRPPKAPADRQGEVVKVRLTSDQLDKLDATRGNCSRSAWLALRAGLTEPKRDK